ncbi:MAG: hypothetical protein GY928_16300 [Colwellia sp.]|nr:hypothetical protein [Colwellia sp.]
MKMNTEKQPVVASPIKPVVSCDLEAEIITGFVKQWQRSQLFCKEHNLNRRNISQYADKFCGMLRDGNAKSVLSKSN